MTHLGCCLTAFAGEPPTEPANPGEACAQAPAPAPDPKAVEDAKARKRIISGGKVAVDNALVIKKNWDSIGKSGAANLMRMADGTKTMAKVGKSLGMVGAGVGMAVGILEMFGVVESESAKMERLLGEISKKIENLESKMDARFDSLEDKLKKLDASIRTGFAKTQILPSITKLDTIQGYVEKYYQGLAAKNPNYAELDRLEKSLVENKSTEILEAMNTVHSVVLGKRFATNMLEADYESSFGDLGKLAETAYLITKLVSQAEHNYVLVQVLQLKRGDEDELAKNVPNAKDRVTRNPDHPQYSGKPIDYLQVEAIVSLANKDFGPKLEQISTVLNEYTLKGVAERTANAKKFLEEKLGGKGNITRKNADNATSHGAQGEQSTTGFKKTLTAPSNTRDYEKKYGTLAEELKAKYLCDWLVTVYHPIHIQSQRSYTGMANHRFWNWDGSNYIWFLENDKDYILRDSEHSQMLFVLCRWSEFTDFVPAPVATKKELDDTATQTIYSQVVDFRNRLGTSPVGFPKETGLVMEFRVGNDIKSTNGVFEHFWANSYGPPNITKSKPPLIISAGTHTGDHKGLNDSDYGSLYIHTTNPRSMLVQEGKGRLVVSLPPSKGMKVSFDGSWVGTSIYQSLPGQSRDIQVMASLKEDAQGNFSGQFTYSGLLDNIKVSGKRVTRNEVQLTGTNDNTVQLNLTINELEEMTIRHGGTHMLMKFGKLGTPIPTKDGDGYGHGIRKLTRGSPVVPETTTPVKPVVPAPARVSFDGEWTGTFKNSANETGKEMTRLKEDGQGNITGIWSFNVNVTGKRVDNNTCKLSGKTDTRSFQMTVAIDKGGEMTIDYAAMIIATGKTYSGQSKLSRGSPVAPAPVNPVVPAPASVSFDGEWAGTFKNSSNETGKEMTRLKEDGQGNITGIWSFDINVSGKRVNNTTCKLSGKTDTRSFQMTVAIDKDGEMTIDYTATFIGTGKTYSGQGKLKKAVPPAP